MTYRSQELRLTSPNGHPPLCSRCLVFPSIHNESQISRNEGVDAWPRCLVRLTAKPLLPRLSVCVTSLTNSGTPLPTSISLSPGLTPQSTTAIMSEMRIAHTGRRCNAAALPPPTSADAGEGHHEQSHDSISLVKRSKGLRLY